MISSITPDAPHLMPGERDNAKRKDGYGYQWWIPDGDEGELWARGVFNQYIYINPSRDIVIVKLSANQKFYNYIF